MKFIIGLSLAALSLQGIVMGSFDKRFDGQQLNNAIINQRPVENELGSNGMIIKQRPFNNDVFQRPIMTQTPVVTQTPVINQIPIIKRPYFENANDYQIGYYRPPVVNIQQPIYPQPVNTIGIVNPTPIPVVQSTPIVDGNIIPQRICRIAGQYHQLCVPNNIYLNENLLNNAPYKARYKCLKNAICAFKDNKCQWLQTVEFKRCLRRIMNRRLLMNDYNLRRSALLEA